MTISVENIKIQFLDDANAKAYFYIAVTVNQVEKHEKPSHSLDVKKTGNGKYIIDNSFLT